MLPHTQSQAPVISPARLADPAPRAIGHLDALRIEGLPVGYLASLRSRRTGRGGGDTAPRCIEPIDPGRRGHRLLGPRIAVRLVN